MLEAANIPRLTGVTCSFCKRDQAVVNQMVAGKDGHHVCNFCIKILMQQIPKEKA